MGTRAAVSVGSLLAGRYRLAEPLPDAVVGSWRARDDIGDRDVAARQLPLPAGDKHEAARQRALREVREAARLRHAAIVTIYDVVEHDGVPWVVTELVPAPTLDQVLRTRGPVMPVEAAWIGLRVLEALEVADAAGLRHRDLTPASVHVGADGRVMVAGLGLNPEPEQSPGRPAAVTGSVDFVAPERARGVPTTGIESDLWSLGATLYAAVEGRMPFRRNAALATLAAVVTDEPPPPRRAGALRPLIDALLIKDPAHRLGVADARRLLDGVVRGVPVTLTAPRRASAGAAPTVHSGSAPNSATPAGPLGGAPAGRPSTARPVAAATVGATVGAAGASRTVPADARTAGAAAPRRADGTAAENPGATPGSPESAGAGAGGTAGNQQIAASPGGTGPTAGGSPKPGSSGTGASGPHATAGGSPGPGTSGGGPSGTSGPVASGPDTGATAGGGPRPGNPGTSTPVRGGPGASTSDPGTEGADADDGPAGRAGAVPADPRTTAGAEAGRRPTGATGTPDPAPVEGREPETPEGDGEIHDPEVMAALVAFEAALGSAVQRSKAPPAVRPDDDAQPAGPRPPTTTRPDDPQPADPPPPTTARPDDDPQPAGPPPPTTTRPDGPQPADPPPPTTTRPDSARKVVAGPDGTGASVDRAAEVKAGTAADRGTTDDPPRVGPPLPPAASKPPTPPKQLPRPPLPPAPPTRSAPSVNGQSTSAAPGSDGPTSVGTAHPARNGHAPFPSGPAAPAWPAPAPRPTPAQPRIEELSGGSASRRRSMFTVLAIVLVVLAAVLIPLAVDRARDGGPQSAPPTAPSTDRVSSSPSPEAAAPAPAGFRLHRDPTGFSIAVPNGWREERTDSLVDFRDPTSSRFIRIDQRPDPRSEPYDDWIGQEPQFKKRLPGYDLQRIANVQYRGWPAADWEFTWGAAGSERSHVRIRNVVPNQFHGYALYWSTTDSQWTKDLTYFDIFVRTFAPKAER